MIENGKRRQPPVRPVLLVLASTYPRWVGDPEPGFVHELSRRMTGSFRVIALVPHSPGSTEREEMDGVEVIRYRYAPARLETLVNDGGIVTNLRRAKWKILLVPAFVIAQAWWTWRLIRREQIDVIHAHWLVPQGLIAASVQTFRGHRVPYVVTSHGADLYALRGRLMQAIKRFVVRRAESVTVVSRAMIDRLREVGADVGKILVLPMGVDLSGRFAQEPGVVRSERELLFVGRLVEKKGLRFLIDAMPTILRDCPDATLTVAGFGPEEPSLKEQVRAMDLQHAIHFVGSVPQGDLPSMYRRAALFVAPFIRAESGDEEGLGLVLIEAMGCGCPVVAGEVAAMEEIFGPSSGDVVVNPKDRKALAGKVLNAVLSPEISRAAVENVRLMLKEKFDWNRVAVKYVRLLLRASGASVNGGI